jgi:hypothetical protein
MFAAEVTSSHKGIFPLWILAYSMLMSPPSPVTYRRSSGGSGINSGINCSSGSGISGGSGIDSGIDSDRWW